MCVWLETSCPVGVGRVWPLWLFHTLSGLLGLENGQHGVLATFHACGLIEGAGWHGDTVMCSFTLWQDELQLKILCWRSRISTRKHFRYLVFAKIIFFANPPSPSLHIWGLSLLPGLAQALALPTKIFPTSTACGILPLFWTQHFCSCCLFSSLVLDSINVYRFRLRIHKGCKPMGSKDKQKADFPMTCEEKGWGLS